MAAPESRLPSGPILAVAALQGLALSLERDNWRRLGAGIGLYALVLTGPSSDIRCCSGNSWRIFLTTLLALAFVAGVAVVLSLWAALFAAVGIGQFAEVFSKPWFAIPAGCVAFGLGTVVFRNLSRTIDGITALLEGLIRLLLPLVVVITLIFLATLPFTGLGPLWATWSGTGLLLWLVAFVLFFANAVYQDGKHPVGYPAAIHALIAAGIVLLPILAALSLYGL